MVDGVVRRLLGDPGWFARGLAMPLRSYQLEPALAIARSLAARDGKQFALMFARQSGKNQVSAMVEAWALARFRGVAGAQLVKAAPTFRPQCLNSMMRLRQMLGGPLTKGWRESEGFMIELGLARALFFSAGPGANVVGATASIALEFDEAQDLDAEKVTKDFLPMAASTNASRIYYGTAWTEDTVLARALREAGPAGSFVVPWWRVAEEVPGYGRFVEAEKARLGADHPLYLTQYELKALAGGGRLFSPGTLGLMRGAHPRERVRGDGAVYVAGVDVAGESEVGEDDMLRAVKPRKDSTVAAIARVNTRDVGGMGEPRLEVVDFHWWTGRDHRTQLGALLRLLNETWGVARVCVDGTGVGAGIGSFLLAAMGERCEVVQFSQVSKSGMGFGLTSLANSGGFVVYHSGLEDLEAVEWWREAEACRQEPRGERLIGWFVPVEEGHDDFVSAAALCARAAAEYRVIPSGSVLRAKVAYEGERG